MTNDDEGGRGFLKEHRHEHHSAAKAKQEDEDYEDDRGRAAKKKQNAAPKKPFVGESRIVHAALEGSRIHRDSLGLDSTTHAVTKGDDIHFAPGKYQPDTKEGQWLIAHEMAHVAQQRLSASDVGAGAPGSRESLEQDADRVATAVVSGGDARVRVRAAPGMELRFDSYEHRGMARAAAGGQTVKLDCGLEMGWEEAVWLGDFYDSYEALKKAPRNEVERLLHIVDEQEKTAQANKGHLTKDQAASFDGKFQAATAWREKPHYEAGRATGKTEGEAKGTEGKAYLTLAGNNYEHFSGESIGRWQREHEAALQMAQQAYADKNLSLLNNALLRDGFACHFLGDAFASGHLVSGIEGRKFARAFYNANSSAIRSALRSAAMDGQLTAHPDAENGVAAAIYAGVHFQACLHFALDYIDSLLLKLVHDHFNAIGLQVMNERGDAWLAKGDGHAADSDRGRLYAMEAMALSRRAVDAMGKTGHPANDLSPKQLIPSRVEWKGKMLPAEEFAQSESIFDTTLKPLVLDNTQGNQLYQLLHDNWFSTAGGHVEGAAAGVGRAVANVPDGAVNAAKPPIHRMLSRTAREERQFREWLRKELDTMMGTAQAKPSDKAGTKGSDGGAP